MEGTSAAGVRAAGDQTLRRLVERAQEGDRGAVEQLYLSHSDRVYSFLAMTVGNRHDAEDLTIQTFVRMMESIDQFTWQSVPFSAWLLRIARNLAIDHFRANRRWHPEEEVPDPPGVEEPSAEEQAMRSVGLTSLQRWMRLLPREQQQVLALKILWSFSNAEAAEILEKTEGAVKALQHRALTSLQRYALPQAA